MGRQQAAKPVNALSRGIAILRYLGSRGEPVGVIQVARDLSLNPSTCFNLLRTLVHEHLLTFDPATKKYAPGLGMLVLAHAALEHHDHIQLLHPKLERIAMQHKVTVMLWQLVSTDRVMVVDLATTPTPLRVQFVLGQRLPSLIGALGRCFAAYLGLTREEILSMFQELHWQEAPSFDEYWAEVEKVRADGYAVDIGHYNRNFTTAAAPVFGRDGKIVMAISAITFSNDIDALRLRHLVTDLKRIAQEASDAQVHAGARPRAVRAS